MKTTFGTIVERDRGAGKTITQAVINAARAEYHGKVTKLPPMLRPRDRRVMRDNSAWSNFEVGSGP